VIHFCMIFRTAPAGSATPQGTTCRTRDVAQELRWIGEGGSQVGVPAPVIPTRRPAPRLAWSVAAIAAVAAVAATVIAWRIYRIIEAPQVMRFSAPNTISARPTETYGTIAISPGRRS